MQGASKSVRTITDAERRRRLGARHALARRTDLETAVRSVVCLHATELASVYLSAWARSGSSREEIGAAMYDARSIVRQLAMRRTVFGFPRDLIPAVLGSAAARVEAQLGTRLAKEVVEGGLAVDGARWLVEQREAIHAVLAEQPRGTAELRGLIPALDRRIEISPGKEYGGSFPIAPRVLTVLAASGAVMRGANLAGWRTSRPAWTLAADWLGESVEPTTARDGYRELVRRWLDRFAPGTEADLVWWLGGTKGAVRAALADLDAEPVRLEDGTPAWVLPGDETEADADGWAALLPPLDPTTMGWQRRDFYLVDESGDLAPEIFDRNGNGGATVWVDGAVVGTWVQARDGRIHPLLLREVPTGRRRRIEDLAEEMTVWAGGDQFSSIYQAPAARAWLREYE